MVSELLILPQNHDHSLEYSCILCQLTASKKSDNSVSNSILNAEPYFQETKINRDNSSILQVKIYVSDVIHPRMSIFQPKSLSDSLYTNRCGE